MKALKGLVVGMGVLIAVGLGVIVVTLYNRATVPGETPGDGGVDGGTDRGGETAGAPLGAFGKPLSAFGTARLDLPAGSAVLGMTATDGRLLLRARHADASQWIYIVDLATGATLGKIEVTHGD